MAYTTINKSTDYFNTKLYTGTGSAQSITGVGFQPDLIWGKNRSATWNHILTDAVRGANKQISSNLTNAESSNTGEFTAFGSDGFSVGTGSTLNGSGNNIVSWNWLANGSGSANTDGSITSTVSANTTSGFSIVKWNADNQNPSTIGHGLGVAPNVIIMKETGGTSNWVVGGFGLDWSGYLLLNSTNAFSNDSNDTSGTGRMFSQGGNEPTSTVWYTNSGAIASQNGTAMIAYCFTEKTGFSKFGSYVGNASASDNAFVYCGFKPAFLITKCTSIAGDRWTLYDNKRDPYNYVYRRLFPDGNIAESLNTGADIDFLSNGFKIRTDAGTSGASQTYIFMAFAEAPLVGSNNVPATAR